MSEVQPPKKANNLAPFAYDAVLALALALNRSRDLLINNGEKLVAFHYNDSTTSSILRKTMKELTFQGMTVSLTHVMRNA